MKKLKILTLLILSLGLILCFSSVKTEAITSGSYVHVYINGEFKIRASAETMAKYVDGIGSLNSNGWPTSWMSNSYTSGMTFEEATGDLSGNIVWSSFPEFADYFMNACVDSSDVVLMPIYLWFYDNAPRFATINFTCTQNGYVYDKQTVTWNVAVAFTYSDFPISFWNETTSKYETVSGGNWFNDDTLTICNENYSVVLEGGKTYNFDYFIVSSTSPGEKFDEAEFEKANVPTVFYADEEYVRLPGYIGGYPVTWSLLDTAALYVGFGDVVNDYLLLKRLQSLQSSKTVVLNALVTVDDNTYYTHTYTLLLHANEMQLDAPKLSIIDENGITLKLSWTAVDNADWYIVCFGNNEDEYIAKIAANTTSYYLPGGLDEVGTYILYVKAISDSDNYTDSTLSNGVTYYYHIDYKQLDAPVLTLNDHLLSWNSISNAGFYELYCDLKLIKTIDADVLSFDLYDLDLNPGTYSIRLIAVPEDLVNYSNSQYSAAITFEQKLKSINFYFNNTLYKSIYPSNLIGEDNASKNEYFISNLLPKEISLGDGKVGIVQAYYLDKELTDEIDESIIHNSWSAIDYEYLEIYMDVIQPLNYNGPTLIWKNPTSLLLDKDTITKHVRNACEEGTKDNFTLTLKTDGYTGHGDSPGSYNMVYECKVGEYVSTINLVVRVSASIKVDYLFNDSWYCSTIVAKPDIVSTAKAVGSLPETELAYTIVTYHNDSGVDYYSSKPTTGAYSFLVTFNSTSGEKGLYRFEMNYGVGPDYEFQEEKTNILPIILTIGGITVTIVVVVLFYKKVIKPLKKAKNKKNFHYKERRKYYRKRGLYR